MECHNEYFNSLQQTTHDAHHIRASPGMKDRTSPMDVLLEMQRKQESMYHHIIELEHMNARLLGLLLERRWMTYYPGNFTGDSTSMLMPRAHRQPTPPCPNQHQSCVYFFRICKPTELPAAVEDRKVYTPDFYLHHMGFRGSYGIGPTWDTMEIGLHLCFFGADGPDHVQVKVRISVVGGSEDSGQKDWALGEHVGTIDSSREILASWARGYRVPVSKKEMRDRGLVRTGSLVIRFDVDVLGTV